MTKKSNTDVSRTTRGRGAWMESPAGKTRWARRLRCSQYIKTGMTVLELGCGTGFFYSGRLGARGSGLRRSYVSTSFEIARAIFPRQMSVSIQKPMPLASLTPTCRLGSGPFGCITSKSKRPLTRITACEDRSGTIFLRSLTAEPQIFFFSVFFCPPGFLQKEYSHGL